MASKIKISFNLFGFNCKRKYLWGKLLLAYHAGPQTFVITEASVARIFLPLIAIADAVTTHHTFVESMEIPI